MKQLPSLLVKSAKCYSKSAIQKPLFSSPQVTLPLNFVQGRRIDSSGSSNFPLIAPAYGQTLREVTNSNEKDIDRAVQVAKNSFKTWSKWSGFDRGHILKRTASIIRQRVEELARTEVLDTGKPIWEARLDILGCADTHDYYGGLAATVAGNFLQLSSGSFAYTIREPLGVVGAIGAWNYPFQMASWKAAPALACGNTVVFKPSELTPLTAVMLAEIYTEAGLPEGCFNVLQGQGETGRLLTAHPNIAKVSFTGSVLTGSKIMASCAKDLKKVTLELGGKSPVIIFADADRDNAVKGSILANFTNQGQVCSNGTRVFVEESIAKDFLDLLISKVSRMKIGNPNHEDTHVGATISAEHAQKVLNYIDIAKKEGAKVAYGGERLKLEDPKLAQGNYLRPCVLTECQDSMTAVREEIFGAVMCVLTFKSEDEVLARANDTELGLAGGVFTKDLQRAHRVASRMEAGTIYVNNYNVYPVGVSFGGFKKSGMGRENGPDTLNYYSQVKSVYVEGSNIDYPY